MPVMPIMSAYTSMAIFLFSAIALVIPSGMSIGAAMLTFGSVVLLWTRVRPRLQPHELTVVVAMLLYFIICAITNAVHHERVREYDVPSRFLLAVPALLLLLAYRPSPAAFWSGLMAGASGAGILAAWEKLELSEVRAGGYTNPIQYGNISMLLGILCLAGLGWALASKRPRWLVALLAASACIGIVGAFMTGSRGSWVSLPVCLIILYRYYNRSVSKRHLIVGALVATTALGGIYAAPKVGLQARFHDAVTETDGYFEAHNANTSVGARFEMWRTAMLLIPDKPLLGWGKDGFIARKNQLIDQGKVAEFTRDHTHSHNEYLDALVKRGLLGLASLLVLYAVLLTVFVRALRRSAPEQRPYALAGVLLMTSYIGFGLTQAFLTHNNGVMTLAFMVVILLALMRPAASGQTVAVAAPAAARTLA